MPKRQPIKITETIRSAMLKRPLKPDIAWDADISGFALHVVRKRSFWAFDYSPHGTNPSTGKRFGSTRYELGDGQTMPPWEARAAALAALALVRAGRDPHREKMALRAAQSTARSILPKTSDEALALYVQALTGLRERSGASKRQAIYYATKAVQFMRAGSLPLKAIDATLIRVLLETMPGSGSLRRHVFREMRRFFDWCRRQKLLEHSPCDDIGADERPRPDRSRDNTPSIAQLRAVWLSVEDEPQRDLVRFLLLVPLRRGEAAGLRWVEVDLDLGRIRISAERMKSRTVHELALSEPALAILRSRKANGGALVFPTAEGTPFDSWTRLCGRIRKRIGQAGAGKSDAFAFHDVRRSFVSILAEHGLDVDLLDQVLSHGRKGVLGVYQRASRMNDRAAALRAWASLLLDEAQPSNVAPFPRRANV
jgi:integrase